MFFRFIIKTAILTLLLILFNFFVIGHWSSEIKNNENGKIIRLENVLVTLNQENTLNIQTKIDAQQAVTLWGGIEYCLYDNSSLIVCESGYVSDRGFPDDIARGENTIDYKFNLNQIEFNRIKNAKKLRIVIKLSGQDSSLVTYSKSITQVEPKEKRAWFDKAWEEAKKIQ